MWTHTLFPTRYTGIGSYAGSPAGSEEIEISKDEEMVRVYRRLRSSKASDSDGIVVWCPAGISVRPCYRTSHMTWYSAKASR